MARETDGGVDLLEIDNGQDDHEQDGHEGGDRGSDRDDPDDKGKGDKEGKEGKDPRDEALRETRRALKETRIALKQTHETAQHWMNEARRGPAPAAKKEDEPEVKISVDLVEAVSSGNAKDIQKAMRELGFVSAKEMESAITKARSEVTTQNGRDAELYDRFPELNDSKSEFFKATARIYNELAEEDPMLARSGSLAKIAAELADKQLRRDRDDDDRPVRRRSSRRPDPDLQIDDEGDEEDPEDREDREERERARVARVGRQSGDRGRRSSGREDRDNDALDATQKTIVAKLKAAGADISEEGYRKRARTGIRMSGLPTRRPRY